MSEGAKITMRVIATIAIKEWTNFQNFICGPSRGNCGGTEHDSRSAQRVEVGLVAPAALGLGVRDFPEEFCRELRPSNKPSSSNRGRRFQRLVMGRNLDLREARSLQNAVNAIEG